MLQLRCQLTPAVAAEADVVQLFVFHSRLLDLTGLGPPDKLGNCPLICMHTICGHRRKNVPRGKTITYHTETLAKRFT